MLNFKFKRQSLLLCISLIICTQVQAISLQMPPLNFGDVFVYKISPYMTDHPVFSEDVITMKYIRQETNENGDFYVFEETSQNTKQMVLRMITKKMIDDQHALWAKTYNNTDECRKYADSHHLYRPGVSEETTSYLFFNGHFDSYCSVGDGEYSEESHGPIPGPYPISKGDTTGGYILERPEPGLFIELVGYTLSKPNLQIIGNEESEVLIATPGEFGRTLLACKNGVLGQISIGHSDNTKIEGVPCIKNWEFKKTVYSHIHFSKPYLSIEKIQSNGQILAKSTFGNTTFSSVREFVDLCLDHIYNICRGVDSNNVNYSIHPTEQFKWVPVYNVGDYAPKLILVQPEIDGQFLANSVCTAAYQRPATGSMIPKKLEKSDLSTDSTDPNSTSVTVCDDCDTAEYAFEFSLTSMGEVTGRRPLEIGSMYIKNLKCSIDE